MAPSSIESVEVRDGSSECDEDGADQSDPEEADSELNILVADNDRLSAAESDAVRQRIARTALALGIHHGEIAVRLVDDAEMICLHQQYRGVDETTDVLTFNLSETPSGAGADGQRTRLHIDAHIAVCVDEARRQAAKRGHSIIQEVVLYALHGLMHCLGYDDQTAEDYKAMHDREDEILVAASLGKVFGTPGRTGPADADDGHYD